jgi:hypothetical protein
MHVKKADKKVIWKYLLIETNEHRQQLHQLETTNLWDKLDLWTDLLMNSNCFHH